MRPLAIAFNLLRAAGALADCDYARARAAPQTATWSPSLRQLCQRLGISFVKAFTHEG